ncbi:lipase [Gregarina niphandrodes]|uniref:Lipase n=1 Tax=Gregarina niphandrodes TaxID=110365 RepID=A0A023AY21_GRENI|nr:lipase [Gregarina niphandrodes]EZG43542.1 lipase [Gregarina niphandrodes]|eukprot:XP_011133227.1 lipase [Gregarina niphandrodes]
MKLPRFLVLSISAASVYEYTFIPYISLGDVPDCSEDILDQFKRQLGLSPEYPQQRLFNQLKTIGFQKLLALSSPKAKAKTHRRQLLGSPVEMLYTLEDKQDENNTNEYIDRQAGDRGGNATNTYLDNVEAAWWWFGAGDNAVTPKTELPSGASLDGVKGSISDLITSLAHGAIMELAKELVGKGASEIQIGKLHTDGLRIDDLQTDPLQSALRGPQQYRRQLQASFLDGMLGKSIGWISANAQSGDKIPTGADMLKFAVDDLHLTRFLNSMFVAALAEQIVDKVTLSLGSNITVSMQSPMINVGEALCNSCNTAASLDPQNARNDACVVETVLRSVLACGNPDRAKTPDCEEIKANYRRKVDDGCDAFDQDPDAGFILNLDISNTTYDSTQGNIDRWLLTAGDYVYQYARRDSMCSLDASTVEFLPGWSTIGITKMDQGSVESEPSTVPIPVAVLLQHPLKRCEFAVIVRGTQTKVDWMADFQTAQIPLEVQGTLLGRAHAGFTNLAAPTAAFFANIMNDKCPGADTRVTLSGHSMGGSVALISALLLTEWMPQASIAVVGFACPNALDEYAAELLKKRVIVRTWINAFDAVPKIPCAGGVGMFRCPAATGSSFQQDNLWYLGVSGSSHHGSSHHGSSHHGSSHHGSSHHMISEPIHDVYAKTPNEIMITVEDMGLYMPKMTSGLFGDITYNLASGKANFDNLQVPAPLLLSQTHSDVYRCWLNGNYCKRAIRC